MCVCVCVCLVFVSPFFLRSKVIEQNIFCLWMRIDADFLSLLADAVHPEPDLPTCVLDATTVLALRWLAVVAALPAVKALQTILYYTVLYQCLSLSPLLPQEAMETLLHFLFISLDQFSI